jgi:hypothetical protein
MVAYTAHPDILQEIIVRLQYARIPGYGVITFTLVCISGLNIRYPFSGLTSWILANFQILFLTFFLTIARPSGPIISSVPGTLIGCYFHGVSSSTCLS